MKIIEQYEPVIDCDNEEMTQITVPMLIRMDDGTEIIYYHEITLDKE